MTYNKIEKEMTTEYNANVDFLNVFIKNMKLEDKRKKQMEYKGKLKKERICYGTIINDINMKETIKKINEKKEMEILYIDGLFVKEIDGAGVVSRTIDNIKKKIYEKELNVIMKKEDSNFPERHRRSMIEETLMNPDKYHYMKIREYIKTHYKRDIIGTTGRNYYINILNGTCRIMTEEELLGKMDNGLEEYIEILELLGCKYRDPMLFII